MALYQEMPFHNGEEQMMRLMQAPARDNPTAPGLSAQLAAHLQIAPMLAIGTLDHEQQPWTTLWGGQSDMARPLGGGIVGIRTPVASQFDPVVEALVGGASAGTIVQERGKGRMISGLTIDLESRKRVKLYGRMVAGALQTQDSDDGKHETARTEIQLVLNIEQSLGNCPKYLNSKHVRPAESTPTLISDSPQLSPDALDLLANADLFFVSSCCQDRDMDTNYRGGPSGFVRVISNNEEGAVVCWPEYSGNRLYQTLGNLTVTPRAGICVPNFENGDMLYATGTTEILAGTNAAKLLPRSNLCVKLTLTCARFVEKALPLRGEAGQSSPYNPLIRYLATERPSPRTNNGKFHTATLTSVTPITSSIFRLKFSMPAAITFKAGQYVTLDLSEHLDVGYSHMRDDDPRSLNDDFVRTFTVSSPPVGPSATAQHPKKDEFEITIRNVGVVTGFLCEFDVDKLKRQKPQIGFKGFGGDFIVQQEGLETICFIAAGVGITPLLPSLGFVDLSRLKLRWSIRAEDLALVKDTFDRTPGLAEHTSLFVTGAQAAIEDTFVRDVMHGARMVHHRRMNQDDFADDGDVSTFYVCAAPGLRKHVVDWLPSRRVVFEDFGF